MVSRVSPCPSLSRELSPRIVRCFPEGTLVYPGAGGFSVGWLLREHGYALFVLNEHGGEVACEVDVPPSGHYPWRHAFSVDGQRLLLFASSQLQEVELPSGRLYSHPAHVGGVPQAAALLEDGNIAIAYRLGHVQPQQEAGAVAVLARSGAPICELPLAADALQVLCKDRVWALRRHARPEHGEDACSWATILLGYDSGRLRELQALDQDVGVLREEPDGLVGEGGVRIEGHLASLRTVFVDDPPARPSPCRSLLGIPDPRIPQIPGVAWTGQAFAKVLPLRSRGFPSQRANAVTPQQVWTDVERWVARDTQWVGAENPDSIEHKVLRSYHPSSWHPRPTDSQIEGATLSMMGMPPADVTSRLVAWWSASAGLEFAIDALLAAWTFRVERREQGCELLRVGWPDDKCSGELIHHHPLLGAAGAFALPHVPWLALRQPLTRPSPSAYERLCTEARCTRSDAPLPLRVMFSSLLAHPRWVQEDSEACLSVLSPSLAGPLLAVTRDIDLAQELCERFATAPSLYAYLLEVVANFGADALRLLEPLCAETLASRRWDTARVRALLDALELLSGPEAQALKRPFLAGGPHRARNHEHLAQAEPLPPSGSAGSARGLLELDKGVRG